MASTMTPKVPVYSVNDLKNTTDDALEPYLTSLPQPYTFRQDNTIIDVRLFLGFSGVIIAAWTFYADRWLGWETTKAPWVLVAVVSYFILNLILTYWIWAVQAGEVFRGTRKTGEIITIRSFSKKHSPLYTLKVRYTSPTKKVLQEKELKTPFTKWFSSDGSFHAEPLHQWLAGEIEVLKLASNETTKSPSGSSGLEVDRHTEKKGSKSGKKAKH